MRYALSLPNGGAWADPRTLAELAHVAEEAGWDGVLLEDYLVWQSRQDVPTYDPWVTLAAVALRTRRIRLATNVTPLARRRPWKVAREAVTLDHLSGGRFTLGVGLGDTGESVGSDLGFTQFGEATDPRRRAQMLDEALAIVVGLWSGEPFHFAGAHYRVDDVQFLPRPVQRPRIPIWVGGGWPLKGPTRRAARWDGSRLYKHGGGAMTPDDVRALRAVVEAERGSLAGYDIVVGGGSSSPDQGRQRAALRELAAAGATWSTQYLPPTLGDVATIRARIAAGPPRID